MESEAQERKIAIQETKKKLKLASSRRDILAEKARGLYEASLAANTKKEAMTSMYCVNSSRLCMHESDVSLQRRTRG